MDAKIRYRRKGSGEMIVSFAVYEIQRQEQLVVTVPVSFRPLSFWNAEMAACVFFPAMPSGVPQS